MIEALVKRLCRGKERGETLAVSAKSAAPLLASNATASIPFNDKSPDHKWELVPALEASPSNNPTQLEIHIATCAAEVAKTSGLSDNKGTLCFLEFMDLFGRELQ